jgi:hypothetical protein
VAAEPWVAGSTAPTDPDPDPNRNPLEPSAASTTKQVESRTLFPFCWPLVVLVVVPNFYWPLVVVVVVIPNFYWPLVVVVVIPNF